MQQEQAIKVTTDFIEAIKTLQYNSSSALSLKIRFDELNLVNQKLKSELSELKKLKRNFEILTKHSNIQICEACFGDGGFHIDMGEQGGESYACEKCEGSGLIDKTK